MKLGYDAKLLVPQRDKPRDLDGQIPWVRIEDFDGQYIARSKEGRGVSEQTIEDMNLKVYPSGTVLCSCSCEMGATAIVERPLVSNQTFIGIAPGKRLNSRYVYYLMQVAKGHLTALATGAIQQYLSKNDFSNLRLPLPTPPEQDVISDFLDHQTAKIDDLIAKKERLIELLEEKRTALITRAVTKGLDPDVPMKDSGVEWLGEIPEHWEIIALSHLAERLVPGPFGSALTKDSYGGNTYRVYGQEQVIPDNFSRGDYYIPEEKYFELRRFAVSPGDLLVSCVGTYGKAAVVPDDAEPGVINPRLIKVEVKTKLVRSTYLRTFLRSAWAVAQLEALSRGGTMDVLNATLLSEIKVPVPPLPQQREIEKYIAATDEPLFRVIDLAERAAGALQEYRSALITAAVTGKIDVRDYAA